MKVIALPLALLAFLLISGPTPLAAQGEVPCRQREPQGWDVRMVSEKEPGEPLVVSGTVYGEDGETPLPGVKIVVFHTDARGYYSEGGMDESDPRLCGVLRTDANGRYRVRTIRPAAYATGGVTPHIHYEVRGPEIGSHRFRLQFQGEPLDGPPSDPGKRRARTRPLWRDAEGMLHCERDLWVR